MNRSAGDLPLASPAAFDAASAATHGDGSTLLAQFDLSAIEQMDPSLGQLAALLLPTTTKREFISRSKKDDFFPKFANSDNFPKN